MITSLVFFPLIGALISGLFSRIIPQKLAEIITSGLLCCSAVMAIMLFNDVAIGGQTQVVELLDWININNLNVKWAFKVDSLTASMLIVVTIVSALVHIYSIGYMHEDPHVPRFMSYLSLFTFFMLLLVTSDNFIQLFLGWEGVGLCSYLLIGFWYKKESANNAAIKAFVVNRVGDFGFALGIFTVYLIFNSLEFSEVFAAAADKKNMTIEFLGHEFHALTLACMLLFVGSMGKSAQIGLHIWLPDAMEGPTPVSALIHAATMVTAGVFLVVRCSPIFEYAPFALHTIAVIGAITCIFAATIALTQNDIKKIIAYSTCSQLGYMFFACGVSAYSAAMFHLMTHAFFKALLFLGAGSVIHAMSHEQDIRNMGGIWRKIPTTYVLMWIGSLALGGIYPFAGYFSKDIILEAAFASNFCAGKLAYWFGIAAAFCTAFYSWRLLLLVFHGKPRASKVVMEHIHESPISMLLPLFVLSIGAIASGIAGEHFLHITSPDGKFWNGAIFVLEEHNTLEAAHHIPVFFKLLPLLVGIAGIALAYVFYLYKPELPTKVVSKFKPVYNLLSNKYYFDEIYNRLFVKTTLDLGKKLWNWVDVNIIDRFGPNGSAYATNIFASNVSKVQTGYIHHYALIMIMGIVGIVSWLVYLYI
jgi:NADH-quinone oxidoreductase subunit L